MSVVSDITLSDLEVGSMRLARVGERRVLLVRTSSGVHALDHACPHEGYGLTQGDLSGDLLTCAWHNWKFDVRSGACVQGEEAVTAHDVEVADDGTLSVTINAPEPAELRTRLTASLRSGIERQRVGQVSRDVVRLLRADADPGELVWEAVQYGAPRAEFGWGHSVASATDCLAMVDHYDGDARALPVVQAIAGIAETERGRPPRPLPPPLPSLPADPLGAFRAHVEAESVEDAQAVLLAAVDSGVDAATLRRWFTAVVSDHHLSYGHAAIYSQKAFQLLDRLGWDRAATVLPHLVPTIIYGTREDTLPYMRPFVRAMGAVDLAALCEVVPDPSWQDDGALLAALLGDDRRAGLAAAAGALRSGAGIDGVLDVVSLAVAERMLRYDVAGEFEFHDDFGWLDITHGMTYANAVRWHAAGRSDPDVLRLALWCVFQAQWTGRHEWHSTVGEPADVDLGFGASAPTPADLRAAGERLQRRALDDTTSAQIVHAHAVKTTVAATEEAVATGSPRPLQAAQRFLEAPKLERFVAANVTRAIDFISGRTQRD
ncbi:Rieske (2Fe-2S) protein [Desertimonas flava]|uniref:Rieske (2Fe-2S) protein n=1 Tax=Desertimonas flava TaxID=2064846 RepID=UPI000E35510C|nr:Rieske (2Fe-2S) protein [Desertimonas flava]